MSPAARPSDLIAQVLGRAAREPARARLNARQNDVLLLIAKGFHNSEIGLALGISERTVKYYVAQLLLIFGATNRTELVGLMLPEEA
jgi:DNA-binding CsgD family transcriptional regulator